MSPYEKSFTPTTKRLAEDLLIRCYAKNTIDSYCYHVRKLEAFLSHSADTATPEDVRRFQLHIIQVRKLGFSTFGPSRLRPTLSIPFHAAEALAREDDSVWQANQNAAGCTGGK